MAHQLLLAKYLICDYFSPVLRAGLRDVSDPMPPSGGDFRDRLSRIPRIEDEPVAPAWEPTPQQRNPRPGRQPAARPATNRTARPSSPTPEASPAPEVPTEFVDARRRRRWPLFVGLLIVALGIVVLLPLFRARQVFNSIDRVEVSNVLSAQNVDGTNILLVGTDSRDGIDGATDNAGAIIGGETAITGERTDTIMVLRLQEDGTAKFLSLPRDLWLPIDGGAPQRINTAFSGGAPALVNTVQSELEIPIAHYVQIDLVGFIALVDAVGGVEISIPHPAFDTRSGLDLPTAGTVVLDSTQALAYVRSRAYTERIDGREVVDGTSDLGRVQRQQAFMRALLAQLTMQRDPRVLDAMATSMADAIVIDDATSMSDALNILNTVRTVTPESITLPTRNATIGGAAVLELTPEAPTVLAQFR